MSILLVRAKQEITEGPANSAVTSFNSGWWGIAAEKLGAGLKASMRRKEGWHKGVDLSKKTISAISNLR